MTDSVEQTVKIRRNSLEKYSHILINVNESRDQVLMNPASYSGVPGFKSRPEDRLS
jgi:hypothetical protein